MNIAVLLLSVVLITPVPKGPYTLTGTLSHESSKWVLGLDMDLIIDTDVPFERILPFGVVDHDVGVLVVRWIEIDYHNPEELKIGARVEATGFIKQRTEKDGVSFYFLVSKIREIR